MVSVRKKLLGAVGALLLCCAFHLALPASAQDPDTLEVDLPEIEIQASRGTESAASAPFSVAVLQRSPAVQATEAPIDLTARLNQLPGVWASDRAHFASGERLVVRGMGWRSPFGVRGVQTVLDGVPLTLPDGQAVLDIIDPALVQQIEVIRGPNALFWGNASGGVVFFATDPLAEAPPLRLTGAMGQHGLMRFSGSASHTTARQRWAVGVGHAALEGYRDHSDGSRTYATAHGQHAFNPGTTLRAGAAFGYQDVAHPGALTLEEIAANPQAADARNVVNGAGKESTHLVGGATLEHQMTGGEITGTLYGQIRDMKNPLAFAYIDLDRWVGGARVQYQHEAAWARWSVGIDAARQHDDRKNFDTDAGEPGDETLLAQIETVDALAAFGLLSVPFTPSLELTAGLRADRLQFELDDALLSDGDQSGERTFTAMSPSVGLAYRRSSVLFFANASTAFETPTTTELVNSPDGSSSFNPDLGPQRTLGVEAGARGALAAAPVYFDVAVFHLNVRDRLVPFEDETGRSFFRNAGENVHQGVELALEWTPVQALDLRASYAGSRFVFTEDALDGNEIPGVPRHRLFAQLMVRTRPLWLRPSVEAVSSYYTDEANTAENEGYVLLHLRGGPAPLTFSGTTLHVFAALHNVFDTSYNGSVVINAFGGRYFEPAPGRTWELGLSLTR